MSTYKVHVLFHFGGLEQNILQPPVQFFVTIFFFFGIKNHDFVTKNFSDAIFFVTGSINICPSLKFFHEENQIFIP